jgi:hypothetical protein
MLQIVFFGVFWKALDEEGCVCLGFGSMMFGLAVQKFLNTE